MHAVNNSIGDSRLTITAWRSITSSYCCALKTPSPDPFWLVLVHVQHFVALYSIIICFLAKQVQKLTTHFLVLSAMGMLCGPQSGMDEMHRLLSLKKLNEGSLEKLDVNTNNSRILQWTLYLIFVRQMWWHRWPRWTKLKWMRTNNKIVQRIRKIIKEQWNWTHILQFW